LEINLPKLPRTLGVLLIWSKVEQRKDLERIPQKLEFLWFLWLDLELEMCLSVMDGLYG
jgi:hypothetical protein